MCGTGRPSAIRDEADERCLGLVRQDYHVT
jgi:hypothetical protein